VRAIPKYETPRKPDSSESESAGPPALVLGHLSPPPVLIHQHHISRSTHCHSVVLKAQKFESTKQKELKQREYFNLNLNHHFQ
jgi:hypothetical protein